MQRDLDQRSPDIHWPDGFTPDRADMFSHDELFIAAPCDRVWRRLVDATRWPDSYANAKDIMIQAGADELGALQRGTTFQWETFGARWDSRVHEADAPHRLGWFGSPIDGEPIAYHTWLLRPAAGGCLVITEEVAKGDGARMLRKADEGKMNRGHALWLAGLRFVSENPEE